MGDILGGGGSTSGNTSGSSGPYDDRYDTANDVRGTVERVDTANRRIVVDRDGSYNGSYLRNGNEDDTVSLYYDDRTTVEYQGKSYRPQDLESGDRILADVSETSGRLVAEEIQVLQDASSSTGTYGGTGTYDDDRSSQLRGTVSYIDTRNLTMEVQPSGSTRFSTGRSGVVLIHYDANTPVEYQGRSYRPENLERGDEVEIDVRDLNGRLVADQILVVRDAQGR
ncbi:MAG: hypothetical protein ABUT39_08160 [Acidobacteriota bacterium]